MQGDHYVNRKIWAKNLGSLTSSTLRMPMRCTATPGRRALSLNASVPMSTSCFAAAARASFAASRTGFGAGCQSSAPYRSKLQQEHYHVFHRKSTRVFCRGALKQT